MPALVPGIHGFNADTEEVVDGRNKCGHDEAVEHYLDMVGSHEALL